jgi:hypothetical protein
MSKKKPESESEVGYGKPPREHQFTKGRSGNPKGRPRKERNGRSVPFGAMLAELLEQKVTLTLSHGKQRTTTYREAITERLLVNLASGKRADIRQLKTLFELANEGIAAEAQPINTVGILRAKIEKMVENQTFLDDAAAAELTRKEAQDKKKPDHDDGFKVIR